jgi:hypothetical protein
MMNTYGLGIAELENDLLRRPEQEIVRARGEGPRVLAM